MGKSSKRTYNPNWKTEQRALGKRVGLVLVHDKDAKKLRYSDGRVLERRDTGQLVRITEK